ncbi:hypothetical protein D1224_15670 [Henriciella barbarensis]|uniref:SIR2-like domain-containing protein n=1 Tax=Henriciella barbarensis TaxID=86342 RepID=A0A399QSP1_9PROT|nr:hypothetical protein [Henriciella barbarensis]RIJ20547.1 hypothetical protein D1224_15670 [Henriciella barbarensis]
MATPLDDVLNQDDPPALLLGNGINQYADSGNASWEDLLNRLAKRRNLILSTSELREMSNTERYDILDLAAPNESREDLKGEVRSMMELWHPSEVHARVIKWASSNQTPILSMNFDALLGEASGLEFFGVDENVYVYPFRAHFAYNQVKNVRRNFAVWHPHGFIRYKQSIRLGLVDYMGSVSRIESWIKNRRALHNYVEGKSETWPGQRSWLEAFFFNPMAVIGFGFHKDETFMRWLFLERARLHRKYPDIKRPLWYVARDSERLRHRFPFLKALGMAVVRVGSHRDIYESTAWEA